MSEKDDEDVLDRTRCGAAIAERLAAVEPCLLPLADDKDDPQLMAAYDLASCVTTRAGANIDPDALRDPKVHDHWLKNALNDGEQFGEYIGYGIRAYWIVQHGERIGTIGYSVRDYGREVALDLTSVYVRPQYRRQGWASRVLHRTKELAFEVGVDRVFVSCEWGNQNALRFYLDQGMWVQGWKRAIRLCIKKGEPSLRRVMDGSRATFFVEDRIVGIADNHGDRLTWQLGDEVDESLRWQLEATVPLDLALLDWPIIRNDEEGHGRMRWGTSDFGDFEDLVVRIRHYERHLRSRGWKVPSPNPSFATLPTLVGVEQLADRFDVNISDGRTYPLGYDLLDPTPTTENPVINVCLLSDEEFRYTLRTGEAGSDDIDHILWLHQSPEHYQKNLEFWQRQRHVWATARARDAAARSERGPGEQAAD